MCAEPRDKPRISAVTIFYNPGAFLEEAIESVLAQTYSDWELLLINDGSTDVSGKIAKEYAARFPNQVRCLTHPGGVNRGMSATRNLGISEAQGEFVAFLDADDVWAPCKLEEQMALMDAHPEIAMLCGATVQWFSWTGKPGDLHRDDPYITGCLRTGMDAPRGLPLNVVIDPPGGVLELQPLGPSCAPSMSNLITRTDFLRRIGGFDENFKGMFEDQVFLAKVYLNAKFLIVDNIWDYYRQHEKSCMATTSFSENYLAFESFMRWLDDYTRTITPKNPNVAEKSQEIIQKSWQKWHKSRIKRQTVMFTDKLLPDWVMRKLYSIWNSIRAISFQGLTSRS